MESVLSIQEVGDIIKKRCSMILWTMCLFTGVGILSIFYLIEPKYQAKTQMIVSLSNTQAEGSSVNEINANLMMVNTYKDFIQEGTILADQVRKELKQQGLYDGTSEQLKKMVTVSQQQNSQMFTIAVRANSPELAATAANLFAGGFKDSIQKILNGTDKITPIAPAQIPKKPVFPKPLPSISIVILGGLMVGVVMALLVELVDVRLKSVRFIEEEIGYPILGIIPAIAEKDFRHPYKFQRTSATVSEQDGVDKQVVPGNYPQGENATLTRRRSRIS